jgi:hypothetical protein
MTIELRDLPKVSLNHLFGRMHWTKREKLIDTYKWIIRSQTTKKFYKPCNVSYSFTFKNNPLDCTNCSAMIKILEDCLFVDDSTKTVKSINIVSQKGNFDSVKITVNEIIEELSDTL